MSALFGFRASWLVSFAPANGSNTITNCTQNSKLQNPLFKIKNDYIYIDSNILMHDKFPELLFTCRHASYLDSARIMTWTSHA